MKIEELKPIAACGLYCGACRKYQQEKCHGCRNNEKASWCGIRKCCIEHNYATCAECTEYANPKECKKFNNFIGKVVGVILNSNRAACIYRIKEIGCESYAMEMEAQGLQTLKRR